VHGQATQILRAPRRALTASWLSSISRLGCVSTKLLCLRLRSTHLVAYGQAPSITGYLDAAFAVSPFDNSRAADFSVQLLLALRRMEAGSTPYSSKLHQSVSETLKSMQIPHINEVPVFGGVYHLDIVISDPSNASPGCIAIEVDGPSHFLHLARQGTARYLKFNAETRLKRRLLKRLGWKVVSLPYTRWNSARATESRSRQQQQQDLLASLLSDAGFVLPGR
jgi:hypothetical protein